MTDVMVTSADGTKLAARCSGEGPPIVFVHGAFGSVDTFFLVEPLLAQHHEVWVYSRRGYPGSEGSEDLSPARNVEDMWAVVEAAGGQVHVCGWSAGATVALMASQGASSLRSVILYEPPLNVGPGEVREMLGALEPALETDGTEAVLEAFLPSIGEPEDAVSALRANAPVWEGLNAGVRATLGELRTWLDLPADAPPPQPPDVPTLYLYGAETSNPFFPTPDVVASVLPDATLRALAGQRHLAPVLDPAGFAKAVLEFTSALDA
jgi:pimeloyl-ACP methyl ester carboxylesterase